MSDVSEITTGTLSEGTNGTYRIYSFDGKLPAEYSGLGLCTRDYIYVGNKLVAEYRAQEAKLYYYTSDQINSTRVITDNVGTRVYASTFDPYGGVQKVWESTYEPALKFSGKERDIESGLDYFGARYHSSFNYRWLSVDPSMNKEETLINPQLWNLYSFCHDNPVTHFDPDGREVIRYHDPKLQILVESLAASSKMIGDTLALYQGKGTPDLDITYGDAGSDVDKGDFRLGTAVEPNQNESLSMEDRIETGTWRITSAEIIIDSSLIKNERETKKTLRHEFGHADLAARDPHKYQRTYDKEMEVPYEKRTLEIQANDYAKLSKKKGF